MVEHLKNRISRWQFDAGWLVALVIPLIAILPILKPDYVIDTADGLFHMHRMVAVTTLLRQGILYPRWIPWFHLGYGYPVLNFYAPLATYIGGAMGLVGISAPTAASLLILVSWMLGSTGMYALGRHYLDARAGIVAAVLWSYAPSMLQAVWNQGNLSQIVATALLPWLIYNLMRVIEAPTLRRSAACAIVFSLVILAHQPTTVLLALILIPGVPLVCVRYGWQQGRLKARLIYTGGGLALGAGIAMIFLLPVVLELPYIQASQPATDIPQTLARYILQPGQLFVQPQAPDMSDLNRNLPETVGLVNGLLMVAGVCALLYRKRYGLLLGCVAVCGLILFLAQVGSLPVWLATSVMAQLRFPGRALHVGRLFFASLGSASLLLLPRRWWTLAATGLVLLIIVTALPTVYPSRSFLDYANLTPADAIRYEVATLALGGTSYDEFKPIWVNTTPKDVPNLDDIQAHPLRINVIDPGQRGTTVTQSGDEHVEVVSDHAFDLSFRQFYFPGWSVQMDGVPVTSFPETHYGLLTVSLPAGNHSITVQRGETPAEQGGLLLTLASLGLTVWMWRRGGVGVMETTPALQPRLAAILVVGVSTFALVNVMYIQPSTQWFRQQSPLDDPAYMQTAVHQRFGDTYELLGYTLHQGETRAGGSFDITLYWRALRPLDDNVRPVVQLVNPGVSEAWAVSENFFILDKGGKQTTDYFVSDDHRLQVHAAAPPYVGQLLVQLIDPQTGAAIQLADGSDKLILNTRVRVEGSGAPAVKVFNTILDGKVELWCASVEQQTSQIEVALYWHVLEPLTTAEVSVFLHGFDSSGEVVAFFDGPMLNGNYPATDWLPSQNLVDRFTIPVSSGLERLSVGLHLLTGERLAVLSDGIPVPENDIQLPLEMRSCTPS